MKKARSSDLLALTTKEKLLRHNLEIRKYWSEKDLAEGGGVLNDPQNKDLEKASTWLMTKDINLYDWQEDCVNRWMQEKLGTIKVVTGAGKTILALAIMERLQALEKDLRVAIVAPTIVLQDQWYKEILRRSNLPPQMIGRLGGGHNDSFDDEIRVLLCVLKSASERLHAIVGKSNVGSRLLLIVDECHRAGAPDMSKVFKTERVYSLGLSATPEREDYLEDISTDDNQEYDSSLLGQELGPIIYEMTVHQAFKQGILPEFEIHHYGLPLLGPEREKYENLSRRLRNVTAELRELGHQQGIHDPNITHRTQALAKREDQLGLVARQHIALTNERKRLLYNADMRSKVVLEVLTNEFHENPDTRAILFHESIESVMYLYHELLKGDFPVAVEHSGLTDGLREESIELFRQGIAQVIVSARSLIEGFNVPETDIGIIVASSTSVRQRIQTIGRLLRKGKGNNKVATIYVLYMHDTVDEIIYGKIDWDNVLGAQRNRYFLLNNEGILIEREQAPRAPLPSEDELTLDDLEIGAEYPGPYEGIEYTCDSGGNVFTIDRDLVLNPQGVPDAVRKVKGSFGRFRVTRRKGYILVIVSEEDDWAVKFVGQLAEPFEFGTSPDSVSEQREVNIDKLKRGDVFPRELVGTKNEVVYFKRSRGRNVLSRKEGRGERFARVGHNATDPNKGADAEQLLHICNDFRTVYPGINKLIMTESGHVVFLRDGNYRYLYTLTAGLEFS